MKMVVKRVKRRPTRHASQPDGDQHRNEYLRGLGPLKALQKKFGFTPDRLVVAVKEQLAQGRTRRNNKII